MSAEERKNAEIHSPRLFCADSSIAGTALQSLAANPEIMMAMQVRNEVRPLLRKQSLSVRSGAIGRPRRRLIGLHRKVSDRASVSTQITSSFPRSLPDSVKRRLKALKNLQVRNLLCAPITWHIYIFQVDSLKVEAKFYEEVHALECKFSSQYREIEAKVIT